MEKPVISVIVPVYKAQEYLPDCLASVRAQTFSGWECILVDDGSPDRSGALCDEAAAADSRFSVIHKQNAGVSAESETGQAFARDYWDMITAFTGGDTQMLAKLTKLGKFEGLDAKWQEKQALANAFIEPALDAYFAKLGRNPFA